MKSEKEYSPIARFRIYRKAASYLFDNTKRYGICKAIDAVSGVNIYRGTQLDKFQELNFISESPTLDSSYWFDGLPAFGEEYLREHRGWALLFAAEMAKDEAALIKSKEETK